MAAPRPAELAVIRTTVWGLQGGILVKGVEMLGKANLVLVYTEVLDSGVGMWAR